MSIQDRTPRGHDRPSHEEPFASVLAGAKDGLNWAWEAIFNEFYGPIKGYVASRGAHDPEALTGDVLYRVARSIHDFQGNKTQFRSWIFVIAHRQLIDDRRHRGRRPELVLLKDESPGGDVEDEAMENLIAGELEDVLDVLSERQRDVVSLRIIAGLTLKETASVLNMSVGAVKVMQHRALKALKNRVELREVTR